MTSPLQPHAATPQSLSDYVAQMRPRIEASLRGHLPLTPAQFETPYNEALEYALFPGGKRLRPVLTLLGAELVGGRAAHAEIVECIGPRGMVGGQAIDLAGARAAESGRFDAARNLKTSALIRLAVRLGAILCGADGRQLGALARVAELLGNAYQIRDDLHDLHEDAPADSATHDADHTLGRERIESQVAEVKQLLARVRRQRGRRAPARAGRLHRQAARLNAAPPFRLFV